MEKANKLSSHEFWGLEQGQTLYLNVGDKVMLTRNLWTKYGLCNGAIGVVKTIIYKEGQYPPPVLVVLLAVFENYKGPTFDGYFVPVFPKVSNFNTNENFEFRYF